MNFDYAAKVVQRIVDSLSVWVDMVFPEELGVHKQVEKIYPHQAMAIYITSSGTVKLHITVPYEEYPVVNSDIIVDVKVMLTEKDRRNWDTSLCTESMGARWVLPKDNGNILSFIEEKLPVIVETLECYLVNQNGLDPSVLRRLHVYTAASLELKANPSLLMEWVAYIGIDYDSIVNSIVAQDYLTGDNPWIK